MKILRILSYIAAPILSILLLLCYMDKGWLSFETAANIATVLEFFVVAISIYFISRQLDQQNNLARASNAQALFELSSPFTLMLLEHDRLADMWREGAKFAETDTMVTQYKQLLIWWLSFYENIYHQNRYGLLDIEVYKSWDKDMDYFIERRDLTPFWEELKKLYHQDFVKHFDAKIDAVNK